MTYWSVYFMHLILTIEFWDEPSKVDSFKIPAIEVGAAYLHFYFHPLVNGEAVLWQNDSCNKKNSLKDKHYIFWNYRAIGYFNLIKIWSLT